MKSLRQPRILFFHDRPCWLLAAILFSLEEYGYHCTVIGTDCYRGIGACDESVTGSSILADSVRAKNLYDQFSSLYRSITVNDPSYERLCFERWFYLLAYIDRQEEPAIYLDSDYLLSSTFSSDLLSDFPRVFYDTPYLNTIGVDNGLDLYLDHLLEMYRDGSILNQLALKYSISGRPHFSDMHALAQGQEDGYCYPLTAQLLTKGLCPNIAIAGQYVMYQDVRDVKVEDGGARFYCRLQSGELREFYSLHFQGLSKCLAPIYLMPQILNKKVWEDHTIMDLFQSHLAGRPGYKETEVGQRLSERVLQYLAS